MRWVFVFFEGWIILQIFYEFVFLGLEALLFSSPFPTSMRLRTLEERTNHRQKKSCWVLELDFPWSSRHFSDSGREEIFCCALDSVRVRLRNFTRISAYWRYAVLFCLYVYVMVFFVSAEISHKRELINLWLVRTCRGCWNLRCHFSLRFYLEVCALKVPVADFSVFFGNPKFGF